MNIYQQVAKPFLFSLPPDQVHEIVTKTGELFGKTPITRQLVRSLYYYSHPLLATKVFGLNFHSPLGIGGGFDKDCRLIQLAPQLGFGFWEVGSITAKAYAGNKPPWNIRLPQEKSILVNYGLRNRGARILKKKIAKQKRSIPLIINIAKTNDPKIKGKDSLEDFNKAFVTMQPLADIVNINISCPNAGDGQLFCENPEMLDRLLKRISKNTIIKPVVLKLKPDLDDGLLYEVMAVATSYSFVKGFITANLTKNRSSIKMSSRQKVLHNAGGLSGKPTQKLSNEMLKKVYKKTKGKYPIIGLGGVFTARDAYEKICLGASLVELVTGFIYGGPGVIKEINQGLVRLLEKDGFSSISDAVGSRVS